MHKSASSSSLSYLRPLRKIDKPTCLAVSGDSFLAKPSRATLFCLPTWETLQISNTPFRSRRDRPGIFVERSPCCFRSEEHTSELQSRGHLECPLLLAT